MYPRLPRQLSGASGVDSDSFLTSRVTHLEKQLELALERILQLENWLPPPHPPVASEDYTEKQKEEKEEKKETKEKKEKDEEALAIVSVLGQSEEPQPQEKRSERIMTTSLRHARTKLLEIGGAMPGHEVKDTIWEASLLIGQEYVGAAGSFFLCLGMVLNIIGVLGFLYVLMFTPDAFVHSSPPDHDTIRNWRYLEGHHQKNMVESRSLISSLCDREASSFLTSATTQLNLYGYMTSYVDGNNDEDGFFYLGSFLAMLVEVMWLLLVFQELQECVSFMSAVLCLERSSTTDVALAADESHVVINTISRTRCGFILALSVLRMIVATGLWLLGALWLAAEINIENLVLNAAALEFILGLDEILYRHFVPHIVKVIISHGIKLPAVPHIRRYGNLGIGPIVMLSVLIVVSSSIFSLLVWPLTEGIIDAQAIMCGGDTEFVYVDLDSFPQMAATNVTDSSRQHRTVSQFHADFLEAYAHRNSTSDRTWLHVAELEQAVDAGALSLYPRTCEDHPDLHEVKHRLDVVDFVPFFQAFSDRSEISCESLADLCYATNSFWVRFLCPVTCGCNVYPGSLWVRNGCPQTCEENQSYWDQEDSVPCKDPNKTELQNDAIWISWWVGNWTPWYTAQWPDGFAAQRVPGCEILAGDEAGLLPELLCAYGDAAGFSGSLRMFCPEACGCRGGELEGCPKTCAATPRLG